MLFLSMKELMPVVPKSVVPGREGVAGQADWLLHDGSQLSLRASDPLARFGID